MFATDRRSRAIAEVIEHVEAEGEDEQLDYSRTVDRQNTVASAPGPAADMGQ